MLSLKMGDFISFIEGKLEKGNPDFVVKSVSSDTRTLKPGDLFIPLSGESFDGHNFIEEALRKGACGFITSQRKFIDLPSELVISVKDPLASYQKLAGFHRNRFNIPVIAVTGSNGKTTTKELTALLLRDNFPGLLKSRENFNNEIGVPKTLFEMSEQNDCLVLEFAMRGPGEIALLSRIARPDIGVITNIGEAHIGRLGSREAIARAKGELLESLPESGLAVLNRDNDWYEFLKERVKGKNVLSYGLSEEADVFAGNIKEMGMEGTELDICFKGKVKKVFFPMIGIHNIYNLLAAAAVTHYLVKDPDPGKSLENFMSPPGRSRIVCNKKDIIIIDDTYNSNPLAVKNTLDMMARYFREKRKVAVLGDMLELGSEEVTGHRSTGRLVSEYKIDCLLTYGPRSRHTAEEASAGGTEVFSFQEKDRLIDKLGEIIKPGDAVLVKGSRGMKMEEVVNYLLDIK